MPAEITHLDHPIDVMYLMHKAIRAEAAFESWEKTLHFHAEMEDIYMTPLLPASPLVQENEAAHQRLEQGLEAIRTYVQTMGQEPVTTRTRGRLFGKVVALRIDQYDHLEEEEELVLSISRDRLSATQQLAITQRLILDPQAEDEEWILTWLRQELTDTERDALTALMARVPSAPSLPSNPTV